MKWHLLCAIIIVQVSIRAMADFPGFDAAAEARHIRGNLTNEQVAATIRSYSGLCMANNTAAWGPYIRWIQGQPAGEPYWTVWTGETLVSDDSNQSPRSKNGSGFLGRYAYTHPWEAFVRTSWPRGPANDQALFKGLYLERFVPIIVAGNGQFQQNSAFAINPQTISQSWRRTNAYSPTGSTINYANFKTYIYDRNVPLEVRKRVLFNEMMPQWVKDVESRLATVRGANGAQLTYGRAVSAINNGQLADNFVKASALLAAALRAETDLFILVGGIRNTLFGVVPDTLSRRNSVLMDHIQPVVTPISSNGDTLGNTYNLAIFQTFVLALASCPATSNGSTQADVIRNLTIFRTDNQRTIAIDLGTSLARSILGDALPPAAMCSSSLPNKSVLAEIETVGSGTLNGEIETDYKAPGVVPSPISNNQDMTEDNDLPDNTFPSLPTCSTSNGITLEEVENLNHIFEEQIPEPYETFVEPY